jgi:hypothetical protein
VNRIDRRGGRETRVVESPQQSRERLGLFGLVIDDKYTKRDALSSSRSPVAREYSTRHASMAVSPLRIDQAKMELGWLQAVALGVLGNALVRLEHLPKMTHTNPQRPK